MIFDCDGVLVDSDRISLRIQAERISALGLEMSYEDCVRDFLGLGMPATLRIAGVVAAKPSASSRPPWLWRCLGGPVVVYGLDRAD